jgi:hypothetical protein
MQERLTEAASEFTKIKDISSAMYGDARLQYDYFLAYLDFYKGGSFTQARALSA